MMRPKVPLVEVEILNPLVGKDRSEEKLVVLDVLARDSLGRLFNIEMHTYDNANWALAPEILLVDVLVGFFGPKGQQFT